jgi:hypothetical protein
MFSVWLARTHKKMTRTAIDDALCLIRSVDGFQIGVIQPAIQTVAQQVPAMPNITMARVAGK